ncbi:MAG: response regulator transcription factor [Planctomycetaceae bacterium]|jgi:DNA-binding NarL/FixJ family response regulator|nr:response regulator transcription factor [Planctomycetaceae bacterium]
MSRRAHTSSVVWIVEDHPDLRTTLQEALEVSACGHVEAFASCEASLKELQTPNTPRPDVIILDIGLPGMSGLEGLSKYKDLSPATDIVMFTVFDDRQRVFEAICAGASGYLLKSEPLERIVAAVQEVTAGGAPMTPEIARSVLNRFSQLAPSKTDSDLSDREREVLTLLADGLTKKEIAVRLDLSLHTVDNYVRRIYAKLHVNTVGGAVAKALREGLV